MKHPIRSYRDDRGLTLEAFGALVGVNKSAVFKWEDGQGPAPHMAIKIEEATNGTVSRSALRPDLWPAPSPLAQAHERDGGATHSPPSPDAREVA